MTTLVGATEAARILGVTKPTLYAYVSRGVVERRVAVDGRTSLYDREQLETVAGQRRRRSITERPSIDVQIGSSITVLEDTGVYFRGHDAVELASTRSFEAVAELLWSGTLPDEDPSWRVDRDDLATCRAVIDTAGVHDPIAKLTLAVSALPDPGDDDGTESAVPTARRLLAVAPTLLGGPQRGTIAERVTRAWVKRPSDALTDAVRRVLVLLADHELATSTLAVRVAASVRTTPAAALACGLATVGGRLHGRAANDAMAMLQRAASVGATVAVAEVLEGGRLPGFGHSVYKAGDPRFAPLFETVLSLPDPNGFGQIAQDVLAESSRRIDRLPNVDFALAALHLVGGLPVDAPLFGLARVAGLAAHHDEELTERPVRYRGMARAPHVNLANPR